MSFLGGIMKSVVNPMSLAQLAMGPAGWASLAMRTVGAAIGQQVIQQLGQRLGLPQGMISMAQNSFAAATGMPAGLSINGAVSSLAQRYGLSALQEGQLQRAAQQDVQNNIDKLIDAFKSGKEKAETEGARGNGKGSWLQRIADAMASALDSKVEEMDKLSTAIDKQGTNKSTKTTTDLQVAAQEFSFLMSTASTVIKSLGEGLSTMARKQ